MDNKENLEKKKKEFMESFEESCKNEKKELFEENDYFDTFRNNQATISYDEENEDIERIPYKEEDSNKKIVCFIFIAIGMALLIMASLLTLTLPWGDYISKGKIILYFFFGCGGLVYSIYQIFKIRSSKE